MKLLRRAAFLVLMLPLIIILTVVVTRAQSTEPACEGEHLEAVRTLGLTYISALNAGDLDPWYAVLSDDYRAFYPGAPGLDKDAARANDEGLMATFPGFQTEIHMSTVSADCRFVTFHWTSRGKFDGPMGDIPPTGNSVEVPGITIVEVADGQIVSERVSYDVLSLLTQMGLMGGNEDTSAETKRQALINVAAEITKGNFDALSQAVSEDYVVHTPQGDLDGSGVAGFFMALSNALTDFSVVVNQVMVEGSFAAIHVTISGIFENDFVGPTGTLPPTGQPFALETINIFEFNEDGLIAEEWVQFDNVSFLTQLGAMGTPTETASS